MNALLTAVKGFLSEIKANAQKDPEAAHSLRDDLYVLTLTNIANGGLDPDDACKLASEALKAQKIELKWEACV